MPNLKSKFKKNFLIIIFTDIGLVILSYACSYLLRFDLKFSYAQYYNFKKILLPVVILKIATFYQFGIYQGMWRYTSLKDLENIIKASLVSTASIIIYVLIVFRFHGISRSVFFIDGILTIFFIGGIRLGIRLFFDYKRRGMFTPWKINKNGRRTKKRVLIVGAGDAGEKILREINDNVGLNYEAIGFLDDDHSKLHRHIHGVKVLDHIDRIASVAEKIDFSEIIIAIPSAPGEKIRRIIDLCNKIGIQCKTLPGMGELIDGKVTFSTIRNVSYTDLLGRSQVELEIEKIGAYLKGKCVLITGAGGSIGSELCRQVARFEPQLLIMLDRAESSLYDIEMEMRRHFPNLMIIPVLGSVTCFERLKRIFSQLEPQVVFHAAAYKHVPMMEFHPWEAVYNNVLGTKYTLDVAVEFGVERFILVSTDKAVRPTNIMGATKRVAEIILQLNNQDRMKKAGNRYKNPFQNRMMAVRFGNVVGSAGSVIPLFKKQIEHGGPITVTHPEVTRYFMTISEAVQLILQAGAMSESGDIYILKMGKPVKIVDMARDLIRLSGFEPDKDIQIEITGLRPGEKLYEELITEGEGIIPTDHDKLMVLRSNAVGCNELTSSKLERKIQELIGFAENHDAEGIKLKLKEIVPEYTPQFIYDKNHMEHVRMNT